MLIDCFPYFNEKELLELRIATLQDYVDGFLITDANRTHRGEKKPFTAVETLKELGISDEKVQVLHVELPSYEEAPDPWIRERGQRDALSVGLFMLPEDAFFICSDCDEIANPAKIEELKKVIEEQEDKNCFIVVKSPKSNAFPVVEIVIYSIILIVVGVYPPPNKPLPLPPRYSVGPEGITNPEELLKDVIPATCGPAVPA